MESAHWKKVNEFLLDCGSVRDPKDFCVRVLHKVNSLIPFDKGRLFFMNEAGRVFEVYLLGANERESKECLEYYYSTVDGHYPLENLEREKDSTKQEDEIFCDWSIHSSQDAFIDDYMQAQGIRYSTGFALRDIYDSLRAVLVLERVRDLEFTPDEKEILNLIGIHLDNLYKNFFVEMPDDDISCCVKEGKGLTPREEEIAEMLRRGISPQRIAEKLYISKTTVNKHINHIHSKLGVRNRQELIVKLMGDTRQF